MVARGTPLPAKLKDDAIVEALLELRFDLSIIPEIFFGRLFDREIWRAFEQRKMPAYELPASIRQADPNWRYQPIYELVGPDKQCLVRVGPNVLSYHRLTAYVGWEIFQPELNTAIDALFETAEGLVVRRLGLRYLNALTVDKHRITSLANLDLDLKVSGAPIKGAVNLNYTSDLSATTQCTVRVATPGFVQGVLPQGTTVYVDVDVFTRDGFETNDPKSVKDWVSYAHDKEKEEFFHLLTADTIQELKE